ncbi:unnamed protein product, partial [Protopolystoma xenopodis]
EPGQPGQPTVEIITDGCVFLRWARPLLDGSGGPLSGYQIEICELGSTKWNRASQQLLFEANEARLDGLGAGKDLQFRVIAINKAGQSPPSEPSKPVRLGTLSDLQMIDSLFVFLELSCHGKCQYLGE